MNRIRLDPIAVCAAPLGCLPRSGGCGVSRRWTARATGGALKTRWIRGGSAYPGPTEALDRYREALDASGNGEFKGAKNPSTSRNGQMFSFLDADGTLALHLSDELETEFCAQHESGPVVQYGRTMQGYSSVSAELLADTDALRCWYDRAWEWIGTLPPKATKKPKKSSDRISRRFRS